MKRLILIILFFSNSFSLHADSALKVVRVSENSWAIVGPLTNRSAENLGNNATFGFIITTDGVVLIDSGGGYPGAMKLHQAIKTVTQQPIRYVINTGSQDHRWFGNSYFSTLGAKIISSKRTVTAQRQQLSQQKTRMLNTAGASVLKNTVAKTADITFDTSYTFSSGNTLLEIYFSGPAHTPGDSYVWLPQSKILFSGDNIYTERMLNLAEHSDSKNWLAAFEAIASLQPAHIIPGHGAPTTLQKATHDTYDYLRFLRQQVRTFIDDERDISEIATVDQSAFSYLLNADNLSRKNIQKVYREMEWE
ncbi:MAG: MBL fold metallo-hydrolase [Gammaproteobacteria bacterium]|nr:MBL fold metallo-hydrolase [Gammaproteobacteria bacterium]